MCSLLIESRNRIGCGPGEKSGERLMESSGRRGLSGPDWRGRGNIWPHMVHKRMQLGVSLGQTLERRD